jgi:CHAD domain-containing protein
MPLKSANIPPDSASMLNRSGCILFALCEELLRIRRSALKSCSQDDIHDLRVASRRLRAVLDLFEPIAPTGQIEEIKKTIRNLTRKLGCLRNTDEANTFFLSHMENFSHADNRLAIQLGKQRTREINEISSALKKFNYHRIDKHIREMVALMNSNHNAYSNRFSLLAYFSDASIRIYLPIQHALAASTRPECHETRHELRIAIKKWRYFFEIVSQVIERDYAPVIETLKAYQSVLGSLNDVIEFTALVQKLKLPAHERNAALATLKAENAVLLNRFTTLVESKPLTYTFLL